MTFQNFSYFLIGKKLSSIPCKYYPDGNRGLSPYTRVHSFSHNELEESLKNANEETLSGILVEGKEGL